MGVFYVSGLCFSLSLGSNHPNPFSDALSVDTAGLQKMLNSGRQTATQIGIAAGAIFHCCGGDFGGSYWSFVICDCV